MLIFNADDEDTVPIRFGSTLLNSEHPEFKGYSTTPLQRMLTRDLSTAPSSAGTLDQLPTELVHNILENLDLLSILNFGRTSVRGRVLVESLSAYLDLVKHAPGTIKALGKRRITAVHSVRDVHNALLRSRCWFCSDFAPFLYLPTCERCCLNCLRSVCSLRMIPVAIAQVTLKLSHSDMENIPKLYKKSRWEEVLMVSIKQALVPALKKHGDDEIIQLIKREVEFPSGTDPRTPAFVRTLAGRGASIGSTPMPSLSISTTVLEDGIFCRGCRAASAEFDENDNEEGISKSTLLQRAQKAFTKEEFLQHARTCKGFDLKYLTI